jgi:hypothetical protein
MTNPVSFKSIRSAASPYIDFYGSVHNARCGPSFVTQCATASQVVRTAIVAQEWLPLFPKAFSFPATSNTATFNFFVCSVHKDCVHYSSHSAHPPSNLSSYVLAAVVIKTPIF